jgi:hypothetical protein
MQTETNAVCLYGLTGVDGESSCSFRGAVSVCRHEARSTQRTKQASYTNRFNASRAPVLKGRERADSACTRTWVGTI